MFEASGSLQLCARLRSGSEAAIHAVRAIFEADATDGVLLIGASNALKELNRATALHNIHVLCPVIAVYAINTYRQSIRFKHSAFNYKSTIIFRQCEAMLVCR